MTSLPEPTIRRKRLRGSLMTYYPLRRPHCALGLLVAAALGAGCSSGSGGHVATTSARVKTVTTTAQALTSGTPSDPVAAAIVAGDYPACNLTVGEPQSLVVPSGSATSIDVRCYTGASPASDNTGAGVTPCNPNDASSAPVYYWASRDAAGADQHVYAAKQGGNVVIVPNETAHEFFSIGGGLASVLLAVGVC